MSTSATEDRWIVRAAVAVASLPLVISVGLAVVRGEWMAGDRSIMGLFAHDVFTRNPPLLGTISTLGNYTEGGAQVHHLGPAQFYALAVPNWLAGGHPAGLLIGGLVINLVAIATVVCFANRRLGAPGAAGIALVCVGLAYGLGPALLRDIWTPYLGLWPLLALLVTCWSLLDGDVAALPWAAGFASFLAQIELLFIGPAFVVTVAGVIGLVVQRRRHRGEADQPGLRGPVVASTVVSLVIWLPVLVQELSGNPGNLTLLFESLSGQKDRAGWTFVWENLVAQLQLPPVWLRRTSMPFEVGTDVSAAAIASAAVVTAALVALTVRALRRWDEHPTVGALLVVSWAMLLGGAFNLAITPLEGLIGLQYRRWMWPAGAFTWFAMVVAVATELADRRSVAEAEPADASPPLARTLLALAAIAVIPAAIGQHTPLPDDLATNEVVESAWPPLERRLPPQRTHVQLVGATSAFAVGPEVIRRLAVQGYGLTVPEPFRDSFGDHRVLDPSDPPPQTIAIVSGEGSLAPPQAPVQVLSAGRIDGGPSEAFVAELAPLLEQVRQQGPFELGAAAASTFDDRWGEDHPDPAGATAALLGDPSRAMFDLEVLDLQSTGQLAASPLTDEQARWLAEALRDTQVMIYLLPPP